MANSTTEAEVVGNQKAMDILEEFGEAPSFEDLGPPIHSLPPDLDIIEPDVTRSPTEALETQDLTACTVGESTTSGDVSDGNNGSAGLQAGMAAGIVFFRMVLLLLV